MAERKKLLPEKAFKAFHEQPRYADCLNELLNIYLPLLIELPNLRERPEMMAEHIKATSPNSITDVATQADLYAQTQVKLGITGLGWQFWGEEGEDGKLSVLDPLYPFTVIMDPIEGTNNFRWRIDEHWGSVLALVDNQSQEPVVGIVAHPVTKRLYIGIKSAGAYEAEYDKQGTIISFEKMSQQPQQAVFTYNNSPHFDDVERDQIDRFMSLGEIISQDDYRRATLGIPDKDGELFYDYESGALEAIQARGSLFFKTDIEMAAVFVILKELGGYVSDAEGNPWKMGIHTLIAARTKQDYDFLKGIYDKVISQSS